MKILEVLFDTDVIHEYDEHHKWSLDNHCLDIHDVLGEPVASYHWDEVVYVRYADKPEASDVHPSS